MAEEVVAFRRSDMAQMFEGDQADVDKVVEELALRGCEVIGELQAETRQRIAQLITQYGEHEAKPESMADTTGCVLDLGTVRDLHRCLTAASRE